MLHATTKHDGKTPLTKACSFAHFDVIKWILTRDPSTANHVDNGGYTALHLNGLLCGTDPDTLERAKLLLQKDLKMSWARNEHGKTPVMIAQGRDSNSEVTLFLKHVHAKSLLKILEVMVGAMETNTLAIYALDAVKDWLKADL